jgi:2-hydroxychromene-2-carboxylate isomerase
MASHDPIDFYFDFSSPYGYFAAMRIDALAMRNARKVRWYAYLMGAAMKRTGAQPLVSRELVAEYARRDLPRTARYYGIPFSLPEPFPVATVAAGRAFWWLNDRDRELAIDLAKSLYRAYFVDGRNISQPQVVLDVAAQGGVDRAGLEAALADDAVKDRFRQVTDDAVAAGVFGSPFVIADGEPFWGNDRLDQVDEWLARGGW